MFELHIPSCLEGHFLGIRQETVELYTKKGNVFYYVDKRFFIFVTFSTFLTFFIITVI